MACHSDVNTDSIVLAIPLVSPTNAVGVRKAETTYHNAACDGCQVSPIVGARWKCSACADFDLCDKCFSIFSDGTDISMHDIGHSFLPQESPLASSRVIQALEMNRFEFQIHFAGPRAMQKLDNSTSGLQFSVRAHVHCKHPKRGWSKLWVTGRVRAQNYEQPAGIFNPYQIRLDHGAGFMIVETDHDDCIKIFNEDQEKSSEINLSSHEIQSDVRLTISTTVVLIACNTARGEIKAEGVLGLARANMPPKRSLGFGMCQPKEVLGLARANVLSFGRCIIDCCIFMYC